MDFLLDEEQRMLRDMVERFVEDRYPPTVRPTLRTPETGHVAANWAMLAELGLLAMPFGMEAGGLGGSPIEQMIVAEALGRGVVAEPVLAEVLMAGMLVERAGSDAQRERWLPKIIDGSAHLALAFAEPSARFAFDHADCRASGGRLTGAKTFVMAGSDCEGFIVTGSDGLWLVEAGAAGLTRRAYRLIDGSPALELDLNDTPAEPMPGGLSALRAHVDMLRVPIAAELVGLMGVLFDLTLDHVKIRRQFGTSIGSFQALQHRMADLYLALEQSRSLLYRAAMADGPDGERTRLAAKSYISAAAVRMGEEAIQMHGGMGVTDEVLVGHAHKRVLLLASLFGDSDTEAMRYMGVAA